MGERSAYEPGTFCWVDLTTTDQSAAKEFYGGLFGWEAQDMPTGEGAVYSLMQLGGRSVGAIAPQPPQQRDAGVPPVWNSYVSVTDADAAVERAKELGGGAHTPAFDVDGVGRMAVLTDPQGAFFIVWQAGSQVGAELVNEPGAFTWNELSVADIDAAASFYGGLFGWSADEAPGMQARYLVIKNGERANGGIMAPMMPDVPPHWLVYFGVQDIEQALARVRELRGNVLAGPIELPMARIGIVQDAQGATFALYAGQMEA